MVEGDGISRRTYTAEDLVRWHQVGEQPLLEQEGIRRGNRKRRDCIDEVTADGV